MNHTTLTQKDLLHIPVDFKNQNFKSLVHRKQDCNGDFTMKNQVFDCKLDLAALIISVFEAKQAARLAYCLLVSAAFKPHILYLGSKALHFCAMHQMEGDQFEIYVIIPKVKGSRY